MSQLTLNSSGEYILMALEDTSTTNQVVIIKAVGDDTWSEVLNVAGTACNVAPDPGDDNLVYILGDLGTDLKLYSYEIDTDTLTDISPSSLGAAVANLLAIDPSDPDHMILAIDGDIKFYITDDKGSTWSEVDTLTVGKVDALIGVWGGLYWPTGALWSQFVLGSTALFFSPNEFEAKVDLTSPIPTTDTITKLE